MLKVKEVKKMSNSNDSLSKVVINWEITTYEKLPANGYK